MGSALKLFFFMSVLSFWKTAMCGRTTIEVLGTPVIYRGEDAGNNFKYMVYIMEKLTSRNFSVCSGSLIKAEWVLTAAHCNSDPCNKKLDIYGGTNDFSFLFDNSFDIRNHPNLWHRKGVNTHTPSIWEYYQNGDIALVQLDEPVKLGPYAEPIPIARDSHVGLETDCLVIGFGRTELGNPRKLKYGKGFHLIWLSQYTYCDSVELFCARSHSSAICSGDSGGPYVCRGKVYGVASGGSSKNCSIGLKISVFINLAAFLPWVDNVLFQHSSTPDNGSVKRFLPRSSASFLPSLPILIISLAIALHFLKAVRQ